MEIFLNVAAIFQALTAIATGIIIFVKPVRQWFLCIKDKKKEENAQELAEQESVKCLLRSEIVRIYYMDRDVKKLHSFEYENVALLYQAYKAMGGNSFIDKVWEEIKEWEIIP